MSERLNDPVGFQAEREVRPRRQDEPERAARRRRGECEIHFRRERVGQIEQQPARPSGRPNTVTFPLPNTRRPASGP